MKRLFLASFLFVCTLVFIVAPLCFAEKPASVVDLSNGFPSGFHHTLNLIAKWDHFACPQPEYFLLVTEDNNNDGDDDQLVETCDEGDVCAQTDQQIFKNVIFFPREQTEGEPISVLMESGKNGPKGATNITELQVTDWCTESFPDDGEIGQGDPAVLRLPKGEYAVYARITGKTGKDGIERTFVMNPYVSSVEDEAGNNLIPLGLIDTEGVLSWNGGPLQRTDNEKKGKGVRKATNISSVFWYTGSVCYIEDESYCYDDLGINLCSSAKDLCCADTNGDGAFELCDELGGVGIDPGDGSLVCPTFVDGTEIPYVSVEAFCRDYRDEWIFSIAEFVGYLWDITTTGAYVVHVRFYPIDQVQ